MARSALNRLGKVVRDVVHGVSTDDLLTTD
jgi:hypothetical protein